MSIESKSVLKSYFETGDTPTQSQFASLIDTLNNDFVDVSTFDTYQDGIDFCAANSKVAYFPPGTHALDVNLNITTGMHIYIAQGATVSASDAFVPNNAVLNNSGTFYQTGLFMIGSLAAKVSGLVFECYGTINRNYTTLVNQTYQDTGITIQALGILAYVNNALFLGEINGANTGNTLSLQSSNNVYVQSIRHDASLEPVESQIGGALTVSGCSYVTIDNVFANKIGEATDLNNNNRVIKIGSITAINCTEECFDLNGCEDVVVEKITALGCGKIINISANTGGGLPTDAATVTTTASVRINTVRASYFSASTVNMQSELITVAGNRVYVDNVEIVCTSSFTGTMCDHVLRHTSGDYCEYKLLWNAPNFASGKFSVSSVCRFDTGSFCKIDATSNAPINSGTGIVQALASTRLDIAVRGEQPSGSTESTTRVGVSLSTNTHTSPIIRYIQVNRLTQLRTTGTITGMELLETISGASADVRFSGFADGQMVFDTTLGKPIFKSGANWIDANGTVV